jgi:hypothetical protein
MKKVKVPVFISPHQHGCTGIVFRLEYLKHRQGNRE